MVIIMKNICLKFYGLGIMDELQANVTIFNCNDKLIFDGVTYNGELSLCIDTCCLYKLIAISNDEKIIINFYVDSNKDNYYFYFPRSIFQTRIITFQLIDAFYRKSIDRGVIILCQK